MNLDLFRRKIDDIDKQLVTLFNQRAELSIQIGNFKREHNLQIVHENREQQVLKKVTELNNGPLNTAQIVSIFRQIIDQSKYLQQTDRKE